jgi:hypothetical protein
VGKSRARAGPRHSKSRARAGPGQGQGRAKTQQETARAGPGQGQDTARAGPGQGQGRARAGPRHSKRQQEQGQGRAKKFQEETLLGLASHSGSSSALSFSKEGQGEQPPEFLGEPSDEEPHACVQHTAAAFSGPARAGGLQTSSIVSDSSFRLCGFVGCARFGLMGRPMWRDETR